MYKPGITILLVLQLFILSSCENPMVNYLLGEENEGRKGGTEEWIDTSEVALWNGTWYYSLKEAVEAADDGLSAASPSLIEIRRNITRSNAMGGSGITIPAGKHIRLDPYTPDTASVVISRWETGGAFFTVEAGASLGLGPAITVDGALIASSGPLVMVEGGAEFTMDGALLRRGSSSNPGNGVYVKPGSVFTMKGDARVTDTDVYAGTGCSFTIKDNAHADDVYLESGTKITADGILTTNPAARITPQAYPDTMTPLVQVLDGDIDDSDGDGVKNNEKFDITPQSVAGNAPVHWRINDSGFLYTVAAHRFAGGRNIYYLTLQDAFNDANDGTLSNFDTVTLIENIDLNAADAFDVDQGQFIRLTVPADSTYVIKRIQNATQAMFNIGHGGTLEMTAPAASKIILDGGAEWSGGGTPSGGASNSGVTSSQPLVYVGTGAYDTTFILGPNVELQNNDRRTTAGVYFDGGAVEVRGSFVMNGGRIASNRTSGNGGGIFLNNNKDARINGGSITGNDAGLSGGGIMLDYYTGKSKLTMTGGNISRNRANGKVLVFVSSSLDGYGGGIFIPGVDENASTTNRFHLEGGVIQDNTSASGKGNGIVVDLNTTGGTAPVFTIKGNPSIIGNDILLRADPFLQAPKINVSGPFSPSAPVHITLDNYTTLPMPVLGGSFGPYLSWFTAAPYHIDSFGRIY
ncbi:MAG: hypothetical protein LBP23_08090 [Treponema sp.]|jgi:hypothetical protein|nr:hypothetical protein [Treponema sp.]